MVCHNNQRSHQRSGNNILTIRVLPEQAPFFFRYKHGCSSVQICYKSGQPGPAVFPACQCKLNPGIVGRLYPALRSIPSQGTPPSYSPHTIILPGCRDYPQSCHTGIQLPGCRTGSLHPDVNWWYLPIRHSAGLRDPGRSSKMPGTDRVSGTYWCNLEI